MGRSRAAVSNLLRLLELPPEISAFVEKRELEMGHARALLGLAQRRQQIEVGTLVAKKGLSVRDTEAMVRALLNRASGGGTKEKEGKALDPNVQPTADDPRVPHVVWNSVYFDPEAALFRGIQPGRDFYFVHSFHFCPSHERHRLAVTPYAGGFASAVQRERIFGVQFHPEKSQRAGFQVLRNFLVM